MTGSINQRAWDRAMAIATQMSNASRRRPLGADLLDMLHSLSHDLFDTYRPELHYMRGPGPKWHAKHDEPSRAVTMASGRYVL